MSNLVILWYLVEMDSVIFSARAVYRDLIGKQRHACEVANGAQLFPFHWSA